MGCSADSALQSADSRGFRTGNVGDLRCIQVINLNPHTGMRSVGSQFNNKYHYPGYTWFNIIDAGESLDVWESLDILGAGADDQSLTFF